MRDLVRRIETLEKRAAPAGGHVVLVRWSGPEATRAKHGGQVIERDAGESLEAFGERAAERFRPREGIAAVWMEAA